MPRNALIQIRRGTSAYWNETNPVLAFGEPGLDTDVNKVKYGNGFTPWFDLPYSSGTLNISDVSNLQAALDGKVGTSDLRLADAREWTAATVSQADAEAGTGTARVAWTVQRVWQAIAAWWSTITVGVNKGGTGATDAATARNNLGITTPPILDLGSVSGSTAINFGPSSQYQSLSLNGTATTFTKGSGWPGAGTMGDVVLQISVSTATTITWSVVTDWFNQPSAGALSIGTHLFLLRSVGSSVVQGHYIGIKTN